MGHNQIAGKFLPTKRWILGVYFRISTCSGTTDGDDLRRRRVLPDSCCTELVDEAGIQHEDFLIAADIDNAKNAFQQRSVSIAFIRHEGELIGLHFVTTRLNLMDQRVIGLASTIHTA